MLRTIPVALALTTATAVANPAAVVPATARVDARYEYELDDSKLTRERAGDPAADPLQPLPIRPELTSRETRQLVVPRVELAVTRRAWVSFAVPIVIAQSGELKLDGGGASTIADGLLPAGGYDAQGGTLPAGVVFRGVSRSGVPELRAGVGVAPMSQADDDTQPTWKLGVEGRFAIGKVMRFDPADPTRQAGVSTGVHELKAWTTIDRRFTYFEGWLEASYQLPIYRRDSSLFRDPGFGTTNVAPGHVASAAIGLETYLIDHPATGHRLALEVGGRATAHLEGRGYSPLWEMFALAGRPGGPLALDADPTVDGIQPLAHPGITNIEGYLELSGQLAVRAQVGPHVTLSLLGELLHRTDHVISFADAGVDLPTCPTSSPRCEADNNDVVNPGTTEVNPLHARRIDLVGHRYHAEDNRGILLGVEAQILF